MNTYNEVFHEKIHSEKPNEELRKIIGYSHKKEKQIAEKAHGLEIDVLTSWLAQKSESELSHILNAIVRETNFKRK